MMTGKPVVLVLMNGRPLSLGWEAEHIPVIVEGWQLGIRMGHAIARVISGDVNPEGKLSVSFPAVTGQCPIYYNHPNTGRPGSKSKYTSKYQDAPLDALYPFGFGLSYTEYTYSNLHIMQDDSTVQITVDVMNTGSREGTETVQLYMQDVTASLVRPIKELKGFKKVHLEPGETKCVQLCLKKCDMGFYDDEYQYHLEDGKFRLYIGGNSRDCIMEEQEIKF